jgi:hypothetical protein
MGSTRLNQDRMIIWPSNFLYTLIQIKYSDKRKKVFSGSMGTIGKDFKYKLIKNFLTPLKK